MSFSKTISVFAALTSIFGFGVAGFKLAQDSQVNQTPQPQTPQVSPLEQRIAELESELKTAKHQVVNANPPTPVTLPQPQPQVQIQQPPQPPQLPTQTPTPPAPQPPTP